MEKDLGWRLIYWKYRCDANIGNIGSDVNIANMHSENSYYVHADSFDIDGVIIKQDNFAAKESSVDAYGASRRAQSLPTESF